MASRSLPPSFSFLCIALNASNSTCPTEVCRHFHSASSPRPDLSHPRRSPAPTIAELGVTTFANRRRRRSVRENLATLHRYQQPHTTTHDFRAVQRDSSCGRPL